MSKDVEGVPGKGGMSRKEQFVLGVLTGLVATAIWVAVTSPFGGDEDGELSRGELMSRVSDLCQLRNRANQRITEVLSRNADLEQPGSQIRAVANGLRRWRSDLAPYLEGLAELTPSPGDQTVFRHFVAVEHDFAARIGSLATTLEGLGSSRADYRLFQRSIRSFVTNNDEIEQAARNLGLTACG